MCVLFKSSHIICTHTIQLTVYCVLYFGSYMLLGCKHNILLHGFFTLYKLANIYLKYFWMSRCLFPKCVSFIEILVYFTLCMEEVSIVRVWLWGYCFNESHCGLHCVKGSFWIKVCRSDAAAQNTVYVFIYIHIYINIQTVCVWETETASCVGAFMFHMSEST